MIVIYGLSSSNDIENIKYIGKTSDINNRLYRHLSKYSLKANSYKNNWIKSELKNGNSIIIKILYELKINEDWKELEIIWIKKYKDLGFKLTNGTIGGEGINLQKEVVIKRSKTIVENNLKSKSLEVEKYKIIQQSENSWCGERICPYCYKNIVHTSKCMNSLIYLLRKSLDRKCSSCNYITRTFKHSQESKEKISQSKQNLSQETRDKLSKIHKNKKVSKEVREKIRQKNLGKKLSQETKEKLSKMKMKSVLCIETGKIYLSIKYASSDLNINYRKLCKSIKNNTLIDNYTFKYLKND